MENLSAKDLRIGNYLYFDNEVNEVEEIEMICNSEWVGEGKKWWLETTNLEGELLINFKPISLTEEWLEKLGFNCKYKSVNNNWDIGSFHVSQTSDVDDDNNRIEQKEEFFYDYYLELKYVHQLQNLYFALTNEELTIKTTKNN